MYHLGQAQSVLIKAFSKTTILHFFFNFGSFNKFLLNVGQLIFLVCLVIKWPNFCGTNTYDINAVLLELGSLKKCLTSKTHKYALAVERI